jgi:hypothetical protein
MSKFRGTNSVALLLLRTVFHLKFSIINSLMPVLAFFAAGYTFSFLKQGIVNTATTIVSTLLSLNGSILGLLASGFAIYASLQNEEMTIVSVTNRPEGSPFSFLKNKLLIFFKGFFWLFFCLVMMTIIYALLVGYPNAAVKINPAFKPLLTFLVFGSIASLQTKAFIELKVMVFYMYTNSLNQARAMAHKAGLTPADESID